MNNQEMEEYARQWREDYVTSEARAVKPVDQAMAAAMMADAWLMVKEIVGALVDLCETVHDQGL